VSWPSYLSMLARSGPAELHGAVQGVASSAGSLASVIGTLTSGVLYEIIGPTTFFVSATALVVATVVFVAAPRVAPE
jgi:MFS transporter, DHA1 family, tetracycline resistance protein